LAGAAFLTGAAPRFFKFARPRNVPLFMGIALSIFTSLFGLVMLGYGALLGFAGMSPEGSVSSWWLRAEGIAGFFLGIVYLTPVLAFSRRFFIFAYAIAALVASVAIVVFDSSVKGRIMTPWDPVIMVLLLMLCPTILACMAFLRTMDGTD
jgi:hypothetical protein